MSQHQSIYRRGTAAAGFLRFPSPRPVFSLCVSTPARQRQQVVVLLVRTAGSGRWRVQRRNCGRCRCAALPEESASSSAATSLSASGNAASGSGNKPLAEGYELNSYGFTVSSMYIPKRDLPQFVQIDHASKRREREIKEIVEAAARVGLQEQAVRDNIAALASLLPDLLPNMDKMRASEWVKLISDVDHVASTLVLLKTCYPHADISKIIASSPRALLLPLQRQQENAAKVKRILAQLDGQGELDAIIQAVPNLMDPQALLQSLDNLARWFPGQSPVQVLRTNPSLLLNIGEADIAADPLYGELTTAG